ncbi:hypothetical protein MPSEU_000235000 [Mayamaea pseudoterrestris]|nr:hypothetical protein MPSEU_000235000 [Mayamaea pseudoterrestris]
MVLLAKHYISAPLHCQYLIMKLNGPRTYLEIRVGAYHSAEILFHVRRQDLTWFQQNHSDYTNQFFTLLQSSVLPRMFASELEVSLAKQTGEKLPPVLGPGGIPIEVGETNMKQQQLKQGSQKTKRKRQLSKKQLAAELVRQQENANKKAKDIYYAFGTSIQLAYRLEDDAKRKPPVTLVFRDDDDADETTKVNGQLLKQKQARMQQLIKLSRRLIVWCYPYDPNEGMDADADANPPGDMLLPDKIPFADLFRQARSEDPQNAAKVSVSSSPKSSAGPSFGFTKFMCLFALLSCAAAANTALTPSVHRASQLAIGEWDLLLKCSRDDYETVIFPHIKTHAPATLVPRFKWDLPQEYPCRLSMFSNGTFSLEPKVNETASLARSNLNAILTSIHGKWEALPNPYCATDRYFDELVLCSNSRVERQLPRRAGLLPWTRRNEKLLKKIRFRLNCRLHGQYWSSDGLAFHAFGSKKACAGGRMSHGVLVTDQMDGVDRPDEWWRRRVVSGSFVGFRRRPLVDADEDSVL